MELRGIELICISDGVWRLTMPDTSTKKDIARKASDNALTIGLVLAGLVAVLVLIGSSVFDAGQKGDVTATQPSTQSQTTGETKTP